MIPDPLKKNKCCDVALWVRGSLLWRTFLKPCFKCLLVAVNLGVVLPWLVTLYNNTLTLDITATSSYSWLNVPLRGRGMGVRWVNSIFLSQINFTCVFQLENGLKLCKLFGAVNWNLMLLKDKHPSLVRKYDKF